MKQHTKILVAQLDNAAALSLSCAPQHIPEHLCFIAARKIESLITAIECIHDWSALGAEMGDAGSQRINKVAQDALGGAK